MPEPSIKLSASGAVLEVRLNQPDRGNALTGEMYDALRTAIEEAAANSGIHAVLLTAAGEIFCAGNDLQGFAKIRALPAQQRPGYRFMKALLHFPKPVVAAVSGHASGIGVTMLLHCDLVFAAAHAEFRLPFTKLGLVPEFCSSYLLPRLGGHARASKWLLLGEKLSAAEAVEIGLATEAVASGALRARALNAAIRLAELPVVSVQQTKRLMREPMFSALMRIFDAEMERLSQRLLDEDTIARIERLSGDKRA